MSSTRELREAKIVSLLPREEHARLSFMGFAPVPPGLCEHARGDAACRVEAQARWPLRRRMCAAHACRYLDPAFRGCGCGPEPCPDCAAYIASGVPVVVIGERENGPAAAVGDERMLAALREDNQTNREGRALPLFHRQRRAFSWGTARRQLERCGVRWDLAINLLASSQRVGEWSASLARDVAQGLLPHLRGYRVLLAGFRVAAAFGLSPWEGPRELPGTSFVSGPRALLPPTVAACIPHPSGRNRLWNEPTTESRARAQFAALLAMEQSS